MASSAPPTNLPPVVLKTTVVPATVLQYVPRDTADKYQVVAFEVGESVLKLAIVHPEQLKQGFFLALKELGSRIGKKIELYKTDPASFQAVMKQYNEVAGVPPEKKAEPLPGSKTIPVISEAPNPNTTPEQKAKEHPYQIVPAGTPLPPLFELGKTVAYNYLKRVPLDFAKKNRLVSVDFLRPSTYWFLTDGTNDKELARVIPFMEQKNGIKVHMLWIKKQELDDLLEYYDYMEKQEERSKKRDSE